MNQVRLGMEIRKWRKIRKMTQKQLADGICNQSEISRLEKGDSYPSIDTMQAISMKLKLPLSYFFEVLIHDDFEEKEKMLDEVKNYSAKKDYEGLYQYTQLQLNSGKFLHPELKTYLESYYFVCLYYLKKHDYRYCVTELYRLTDVKIDGMDVLLKTRIKNAIAIILAENHKFDESMKIFEEILQEQMASDEYEVMKITILYNVGKLRYEQKNYDKALEVTEEGIRLSIAQREMSVFGQLYYQKGAILEKLGHPDSEISENYQRALFFFDLLGLDYYKKILQEHKMQYLAAGSV
ncbi:helix-turn-helix domain-containing protein [Bhargavaea beijingensis]|uniref:helix-turn-helix domain-containing protein n=1 Tax=Bhargavaea beijingensis TaxID=426756 RepID=UPI0022253235|nr:helix-turn-helix transcriptional regulator [Bhargavaea beijingensis]MCW1928082.1 helix-turn-helix transcriptional regulator [Bhargavaea beijingensis]